MNTNCNTTDNKTTTTPAGDSRTYVSPAVNIYETKENYVLEAEMPGVAKDGLDISLEASTLTVTGRRATGDLKAEVLHQETSQADYRRVFELDPLIDTAKVAARLEQGVLIVTLPKAEQIKPRKVLVND